MARWQEIADSAPDFAATFQRLLDGHVHKTIATLRADGSPRISGIETIWADGDLWFGSMPKARKAVDLQRDPRFALHSGSDDPDKGWEGDAKLSGRGEEITDDEVRAKVFGDRGSAGPSEAHLFRADIDEAVLIGLNDERTLMVIELWRPGQELKRIERA